MSSKVYMWEQYTEVQHAELESLCNRYKECLDAAKTERECVTLGIWMAKEHGYRDLSECIAENNRKAILTHIPMDLDAVNPDIMTEEDKKLQNAYHKTVYEKISPYLNDGEKEWLKTYTREIAQDLCIGFTPRLGYTPPEMLTGGVYLYADLNGHT